MRTWFTIKVKYLDNNEKGVATLSTGVFLVDAINYTEAETRTNIEVQDFLNKEFTIDTVTKTKIHEVFFYDKGDYWWKAKVQYDHTEGDKERKVTQFILLPATDIAEAYQRLQENLKPLLHSWDTISLLQTSFLHVFPHFENESEENE